MKGFGGERSAGPYIQSQRCGHRGDAGEGEMQTEAGENAGVLDRLMHHEALRHSNDRFDRETSAVRATLRRKVFGLQSWIFSRKREK